MAHRGTSVLHKSWRPIPKNCSVSLSHWHGEMAQESEASYLTVHLIRYIHEQELYYDGAKGAPTTSHVKLVDCYEVIHSPTPDEAER
jgi:hypothetical protein